MTETKQTKTFDKLWQDLMNLEFHKDARAILRSLMEAGSERSRKKNREKVEKLEKDLRARIAHWKQISGDKGLTDHEKFEQEGDISLYNVLIQWKSEDKSIQQVINLYLSLFFEDKLSESTVFSKLKIIKELLGEDLLYRFLHRAFRIYPDGVYTSAWDKERDMKVAELIARNKNATATDLYTVLLAERVINPLVSDDEVRKKYIPMARDCIAKTKAELDSLLKKDPSDKAGYYRWKDRVESLCDQGIEVATMFKELIDGVYIPTAFSETTTAFFKKIRDDLNNVPTDYIQRYEQDKLEKIEELEKRLMLLEKTIAINKSTIETQKKAIETRDDIIARQQNLISDYGNNAKDYDASRVKGKVYGHNSDDAKYKKAKDDAESLGVRAKDLAKLVAQLERQ